MYQVIYQKDNETYQEYIQRILSIRENVRDMNNYQEKHHIIPKSLGGSNDKDNLIYLYAEEHYIAHKLLALENPQSKKMQTAWWNMCHCSGSSKERKYIVSPEDYAEARKRHAENMSGDKNYNHIHPFSEESKQKMSKNHCDVTGANNPRAKKVRCIETGMIFETAKAAGEYYNMIPSNAGCSIRDVCRGRRKTAGKDKITGEPLHWEWVN